MQTLALILCGVIAAPLPTHAADDSPEGMTKNMVWLPEATMTGTVGDYGVISLSYDGKEYLVMGAPAELNLAVGETTPALLVRGPVGDKMYMNRRLWNWFSKGEITPELIRAYPSRDFSRSSPLE
jgi:hypothetical protein